MQVAHKIETPPGPAGRWLIDLLVALSAGLERIPLLKPQNRPMLKDIVKNREEQSVRGPSEAKHEWDGQSPQDVGQLAETGTDRQRWCSLNGPMAKTSAHRRHGRRPITSMASASSIQPYRKISRLRDGAPSRWCASRAADGRLGLKTWACLD